MTNETMTWNGWLHEVLTLAQVSVEELAPFRESVSKWFQAGEPVSMAADSLKMIVKEQAAWVLRWQQRQVRPIMRGLPYGEYRKRHPDYDPSRDALLNKVCRNPRGCGCLVVGEGTLQAPIEILFCAIHDPAIRQQRDELAGALEVLLEGCASWLGSESGIFDSADFVGARAALVKAGRLP